MSSQKFVIVQAPAILITMTISGITSASQITKTMEKKLVGAVADSLLIPPERVQLITVKDAIRRLLSIPVTFRVLTSDASDASDLQQKLQKADFQVMCCYLFCSRAFDVRWMLEKEE